MKGTVMLKSTIIVISMALLVAGCVGQHEGLILGEMTKKLLPEMKQEAKAKKEVMLSGQECLHRAKTVHEANICNAKIMEKDSDFEISDFTEWNVNELEKVDRMTQEYVIFFDCIIAAPTISVAVECKEP